MDFLSIRFFVDLYCFAKKTDRQNNNLLYNSILNRHISGKISTLINKVLKICEYFVYLLDSAGNMCII